MRWYNGIRRKVLKKYLPEFLSDSRVYSFGAWEKYLNLAFEVAQNKNVKIWHPFHNRWEKPASFEYRVMPILSHGEFVYDIIFTFEDGEEAHNFIPLDLALGNDNDIHPYSKWIYPLREKKIGQLKIECNFDKEWEEFTKEIFGEHLSPKQVQEILGGKHTSQ